MPCPAGRLLFLGDSLAVGLDPHLRDKAAACGTAYHAETKGGTGVLYWRARIEALLSTHRPTHVLISLGGNDYWRMEGHPTQGGAAVRSAIPELVGAIRAAGVTPLWIRWLIPIPDRPGVDAAWRQTGIPYYDTEPLGIERAPGDPYHPSPQGFRVLSDGLWAWLGDLQTQPGVPMPPPPLPQAAPGGWALLLAGALGFGVGMVAIHKVLS